MRTWNLSPQLSQYGKIDTINLRFSNADKNISREDQPFRVRAVKRVFHGDWKTQAVRSNFMGLAKGEVGLLVGVFDNFYGRWVCVERDDGRIVDCLPSEIEIPNSESREYRVEWSIEIEAGSPHEAAELALEIQRDPASIATVFDVTDADGFTYSIDLEDGDGGQ